MFKVNVLMFYKIWSIFAIAHWACQKPAASDRWPASGYWCSCSTKSHGKISLRKFPTDNTPILDFRACIKYQVKLYNPTRGQTGVARQRGVSQNTPNTFKGPALRKFSNDNTGYRSKVLKWDVCAFVCVCMCVSVWVSSVCVCIC